MNLLILELSTPEFIVKILNGPIFLRRFRLYVLSFMFRFMFANICSEKNQNSKIYVMFIINMKQGFAVFGLFGQSGQ